MADRKTVDNEDLFADVEQIIGDGGRVQLRINGHSMRPFLRHDRDTVRLAAIAPGNLKRGMVVLFRYRGRHILHRIRRLEGDRVEIKGDGNYRIREYTTRGAVAAYVEGIERNGRYIGYRSVRWRLLTIWSLSVKAARTLYHDIANSLRGRSADSR